MCIAPFNQDGIMFAERFGVEVYTAYNSTEMSTPLVANPGFAAMPGISDGRVLAWRFASSTNSTASAQMARSAS